MFDLEIKTLPFAQRDRPQEFSKNLAKRKGEIHKAKGRGHDRTPFPSALGRRRQWRLLRRA
jgi:hypothetical protein